MTTSDGGADPRQAYAWVWLPGATEPVVAGRLTAEGQMVSFTYGRSYLARDDAIALYEPELALRPGRRSPPDGMRIASCLRDAAPDTWGQGVILAHRVGRLSRAADTDELSQLTYLLDSGSDRTGGLDFQRTATEYVPRHDSSSLNALQDAAQALDEGRVLSAPMATALLRGTSIGGARPKVLLSEGDEHLIAKLPSTTDPYPVVKAEGVAMELARRVGLDVPDTRIISSMGRDVLLVRRFDRTPTPVRRRLVVSALTILELDETVARYATYSDLAASVRARFTDPTATLHELFARIVFNVCVGNTDDHARNHAAFWDGRALTLTPAYDLCPQPRSGQEAAQAMAVGRDGARTSQLRVCLAAAAEYRLDPAQARDIVDNQVSVIHDRWTEAADTARLTELERAQLWGAQILNPFIFHDWTSRPDDRSGVPATRRRVRRGRRRCDGGGDRRRREALRPLTCGAPLAGQGSGAGRVRTDDLTDYESAALTS